MPLLRNGIVYQGCSGRLRQVIKKLLDGQPTHIGVIGGASYGIGVQRGSSDWFSRLQQYIRTAFPHAAVTAKNGCVPGGHSEFVAACLDKFVSQDADLILVEFATSDGYLDTSVNNGYVHAFERLVRKLLRLPNSPAVVVTNFLQAGVKANNLPFYHTIEDHFGVIAQYYQLPWLSFRDAVWHGMVNNWQGFRAEDIFLPGAAHNATGAQQQQQQQQQQQHYPSELGHAYMADLAVGLLQQTYLGLMLQPLTPADMAYSDSIPAPMFPNNYEPQQSACAAGIDLKAAAGENHTDWYFVNEGNSHKPRWGYVSHIPKALLVLQLDTRAASPQAIPQLTLQQKAHILQQHGMFAAAAQLQATQAHLPLPITPAAAAAAAAALPGAAISGAADGLQAAMQEAQRQAAAAAHMLQSGQQQQQFVSRERLVGGQGGGFQLPADARQVFYEELPK
ncbi:hypothetical protein OEZ85_002112 [Tetradesmus obliquus]|uniref:SGNH hydrolase-type esterase domain-containing protein n=1 Tax=Tetradesmus obliquus TaxID=3088 RepID=A0ABY8U1Z3_TETOB|nr:hypothetical protein OEZ85_002112 [Tetradesmus obliquus]